MLPETDTKSVPPEKPNDEAAAGDAHAEDDNEDEDDENEDDEDEDDMDAFVIWVWLFTGSILLYSSMTEPRADFGYTCQ